MKNYKLISLFLILVIFSCTGNNSPVTLPIPVIKPYNMPDIKSKFIILDQIKHLSNSVSTVLNDNGNGMFIVNGSAIKISNFKPSGENFLLDNDFGESALTLDEKGNGIVVWGKANISTNDDDSITPGFSDVKYKIIKDYKPFGEAIKINNNSEYNLSSNIRFNIDKNGNGRIIYIVGFNDDIKLTTFLVHDYIISETKEKSIIFKCINIYLDKNGNGFLIHVNNENKVILNRVKNLVAEQEEIFLGEIDSINNPKNINMDFDINGNGFIFWTYNYSTNEANYKASQKGELIAKKLSNFKLIGDEISLGDDYINNTYQVKLEQNGNGIVFWISDNYSKSYIHIREIKKYIPNEPVIIENNEDFNGGFGIITNKFGDGLITWQSIENASPNSKAKYYGRLVTNYNIAKDNTIPYHPLPRPIFSEISDLPPFIITPDGKSIEITTVHGIVKDNNGNLVSGASIKIKSITNNIMEIPQLMTTADGSYLNPNVPVGIIEIIVSKAGYKTVVRRVENESNQANNPEKNTFDFTWDFALVKR